MRYECGNCFRTDREALDRAEELKVLQEMKKFGGREEFKPCDKNYFLTFKMDAAGLNEAANCCYGARVYFDTEEQCVNAIKKIGKERLEKYYFKVVE